MYNPDWDTGLESWLRKKAGTNPVQRFSVRPDSTCIIGVAWPDNEPNTILCWRDGQPRKVVRAPDDISDCEWRFITIADVPVFVQYHFLDTRILLVPNAPDLTADKAWRDFQESRMEAWRVLSLGIIPHKLILDLPHAYLSCALAKRLMATLDSTNRAVEIMRLMATQSFEQLKALALTLKPPDLLAGLTRENYQAVFEGTTGLLLCWHTVKFTQ